MNGLESEQTRSASWNKPRLLLVVTLVLCAGAALFCLWLYTYANSPGPRGEESHVIVTIERGMSVTAIGKLLCEKGVIKDDLFFPLLARLTGKSGRLQAGELRLATGKSILEVIDMLAHARPVHRVVTIPEGLNGAEIAILFEKKGICDRRRYQELMKDAAFIKKLGMEGLDSLEGYLFPDTYYLTRDDYGAEQVITMQVNQFKEVWTQLRAGASDEVNRNEVIILASMVEKETGRGSERSLIAGVFMNRLKKKMRLQSDPTVIYGCKNFTGPITKKQLRTPTPYNTYTLPALPIGPIANPGRAAIAAVLHPAQTNFLYFVAKNDGTHYFSTTLKEHNRAVRKYQR